MRAFKTFCMNRGRISVIFGHCFKRSLCRAAVGTRRCGIIKIYFAVICHIHSISHRFICKNTVYNSTKRVFCQSFGQNTGAANVQKTTAGQAGGEKQVFYSLPKGWGISSTGLKTMPYSAIFSCTNFAGSALYSSSLVKTALVSARVIFVSG